MITLSTLFNRDKKTFIGVFAPALLLFLSGFLIYSNILYAPFVFDDELYIVTNYQIRDLPNLLKDFSGTRYIGFLSFAVNYYFGGLNTFGYHLVNIIIHIINAILVYFLVNLTFVALSLRGALAPKQSQGEIASALPRNGTAYNFIAFSVSLIFLVHPIQTQAVSYITQRFTSLATLFYLLTLVLYVKARLVRCENRFTFYILLFTSYLSAILAMKTKEISFTLPFMIILYEFTFFNSRPETRGYKRFLYFIPYLLTLLIIPFTLFMPASNTGFGEIVRQQQTKELAMLSKYKYLLTQFNVILTYIRLLFLPVHQHFVYDYPISKSIFEIKTVLSLFFLISMLAFAVYLYLRSRKTNNCCGFLISFGIFWFFITLSVESSIIPIQDVIFEHRLYLPSIGFILSAVAGYFYLFDRIKNKTIRLVLFLFIIIAVLSLAFVAYKRNNVYKDLMTIYLDEVKYIPNRSAIHNELGRAYLAKNMLDEAEREFKIAIEISPITGAIYHRNLGIVYEKRGLFEEAEREFKTAISTSKYTYTKPITTSVTIESQARTNLGELYYKKGLLDKAIAEYKEAVKLAPSAEVYNYLGDVYMKKGLLDDAEKAFAEAVRLEPNNADINFNLGLVYEEKKMFDEAVKNYKHTLKIEPNFKEAREALDRLGQR